MNSREHIKNDLLERKISAIIRTENQQVAEQAMQAAVDGGFRVVEFTLTTPGALNLITQFRGNNDLIVGAGTVMSSALAQEAVGSGAQFLVSPVCNINVIQEAIKLDVKRRCIVWTHDPKCYMKIKVINRGVRQCV